MTADIELVGLGDTEALAATLVHALRPGDVLTLKGSLGVGKTTLVQLMASLWGLDEGLVRSPTFSLLNVYELEQYDVIHADLYRIDDSAELEGLGLLECLGAPDCLCIIEWPSVAAHWLPSPGLQLELTLQNGQRRAQMSPALARIVAEATS
ncbi:MAG TPA: tRNA (adenosine(37)-N6)-threonylcarbamoyltransferase complex ATPase subunit type 1 TsaE [Myxococcales bacterium]|nr:tRNA (adenosine(37)-N6)-threonylcarbamoyltransferase complex ATPase subunit type 1 TsaE [Myxococcales bacterium]